MKILTTNFTSGHLWYETKEVHNCYLFFGRDLAFLMPGLKMFHQSKFPSDLGNLCCILGFVSSKSIVIDFKEIQTNRSIFPTETALIQRCGQARSGYLRLIWKS